MWTDLLHDGFALQSTCIHIQQQIPDHMVRMAPTYLFINRCGAIDWNLCQSCVSKITEELSSKAFVN